MKYFLSLILFSYACTSLHASNLFGGEISAKQISGLTYSVDVEIYGDKLGPPMPANITINIRNIQTGNILQVQAPNSSSNSYTMELDRHIYTASVSFPVIGEYELYWFNCCRSDLYQNFSNPSSRGMFLSMIITISASQSSQPPEFLNTPIVIAVVNETLYYNPLPFEFDGDSLVWSLDTSIHIVTANPLVIEPVPNYLLPGFGTALPMKINQNTGEITWKPNSIGGFITTVLVEEYRNGVKIGEIRRDMGFIVKNFAGNSITQTNTAGWPQDFNNDFYFNLGINTPFNLNIVSTDVNSNTILLESSGESFLLINNPSTFTQSVSQPGFAIGEFTWTPTFNEERSKPYIQAIRVKEIISNDTLMRDITLQLFVGNYTSINESEKNLSINIYPNPSSGKLFIPVTVKKDSDLKITFLNQLGQEVKSFEKKLNTGQNLLYFSDLNLPAGIYFINTNIDGHQQVSKIIIE